MSPTEFHSLRFRAPEGFKLKRRSNRDKLPIDANPDDYTLEQIMLNATMQKYSISRLEVAAVMGTTMPTLNAYLLPPVHRNYKPMPANFPMLLESWCKANRK